MPRVKDDAMLLSGDGGFLVRGVMTDEEFMDVAAEWLCPVGGSLEALAPIRHGWYRWVPNLDEGGK